MRMQSKHNGFSLIEFMIVILVLSVIVGAVFQIMGIAMTRSATEQARIDMFQEAREFMDQMSRDLRMAGYPSPRNMASSVFTQSTVANDTHAAAGLVKVDTGELWFEADVDGSGTVSVIRYHLDTSTTNGCPCLKRSQQAKIIGDPVSGQTTPVYEVEVQGVQNTTIFTAYAKGATGTAITLPIDFDGNATTIATIDTVQAILTVQSTYMDPQTKQKPITTLPITVKLNNCSQAAPGLSMSCS